MKSYQEIPEVVEYLQAQQLLELSKLAEFGITEGEHQIELCKEELKTAINLTEQEEILLQVKNIQQHIDVCHQTLNFFTSEFRSLVYLFN
jgi:hypothetical protein